MTELRLPALSGDSPLAILAAIGTLRLLTVFGAGPAQLRWEESDRSAILIGRDSLPAVVEELAGIVADVEEGSTLPGTPAGFPPPGEAPDRLRVAQHELRVAGEGFVAGCTELQARQVWSWLACLITDLAHDSENRVAIGQQMAPAGKQTMATMFEKPFELVRKNPDYLRQALEQWRRESGVTGEYLDHRALWDSAQDGGGSAGGMRAVPGATWLALMSFPVLRTTVSQRGRAHSSGWHEVFEGKRRVNEFRLPLWRQPLGLSGITALIEHPALSHLDNAQLELLGVFAVCRSRRYKWDGAKSAGVLAPVP